MAYDKELLEDVFDYVETVDIFDSKDEANLQLLSRPDLGVTFTKLHCWRLTQYTKAVFMDADTLVFQNIDDLFEREEFSAASDPGWPDCFNSGVFVYSPSIETYKSLVDFAVNCGSFDGGDQGLLNMYFNDWATKDIKHHISFTYNVMSQAFYSYRPAFVRFRNQIRVVHFIGAEKPWLSKIDEFGRIIIEDQAHASSEEFLNYWWYLFMTCVKPKLRPTEENSLASRMASIEVNVSRPSTSSYVNDQPSRQMAWERGQIDYMGSDSFDRIQNVLESKLREKSPEKNEDKH